MMGDNASDSSSSRSQTKKKKPTKWIISARNRAFSSKRYNHISEKAQQATSWRGIFSWVSDCPQCPLLYFYEDLNKKPKKAASDKTPRSSISNIERRQLSFERAQYLIRRHHASEALDELLSLTKAASYKINIEECSLLMYAAEIVIRDHLNIARQVTTKDIGHAVGFIKANIMKAIAFTPIENEIDVHAEKESLKHLLVTLVDVSQLLRRQSGIDICPSTEDFSSIASLVRKRFNIYISLFGLLIQSAFLEASFVSGDLFINHLVNKAEETFSLFDEVSEEQLLLLRPLAAYIYGRLSCETSEDKSHGAHFLTQYYEKYGSEFESKMEQTKETETHSTYFCNMRRIRQTLYKYRNAA